MASRSVFFSRIIKGWSGLELSLTCPQGVFAEDLSEDGNADASGGKKMTRDADNREMYTKNTGRGRPIKRTILQPPD